MNIRLKHLPLWILALSLSVLPMTFAHARGDASFDYATLEELNTQADQLWKSFVQEHGSEELAIQDYFSTNAADPRITELHQNVSDYLKTSTFNAFMYIGNMRFKNEDRLNQQPMSALLRQTLLDIAVTRQQQVIQKTAPGFFSYMPHDSKFINYVQCSVDSPLCTQQDKRFYGLPEDLRDGREYMIAKALLSLQFENFCNSIIDPFMGVAALAILGQNALDDQKRSWGPSNEMATTKELPSCRSTKVTTEINRNVVLGAAKKFLK